MFFHLSQQASKSGNAPLKVAPLPVVKPRHPTNLQPFKFATDSRIKPADQPKPESAESNIDFSKMLRSYKPRTTSTVSEWANSETVKPDARLDQFAGLLKEKKVGKSCLTTLN